MLRLRELRDEQGKTQSEIAQFFQISRQVYSNYENGINEPSIDLLEKFANFFDCSIDYLVGHTDDFGNVIQKQTAQAISPDGKELLDIYTTLSPELRVQVLEYARYFADRAGIKKHKK